MLITEGDLWVIFLNSVFVFILSHLRVDKEFSPNHRTGAYAVIGIVAAVYLFFGVII